MSRQIAKPHRPDSDVARVFQLQAMGYSLRQIEQETGVNYRTAGHWLASHELSQEYKEQATQYAEQAMAILDARFSRLMLERSERALDGTDPYSDQQLTVNYGVTKDKVQRSTTPSQQNVQINFYLNDAKPSSNEVRTIEGEARKRPGQLDKGV